MDDCTITQQRWKPRMILVLQLQCYIDESSPALFHSNGSGDVSRGMVSITFIIMSTYKKNQLLLLMYPNSILPIGMSSLIGEVKVTSLLSLLSSLIWSCCFCCCSDDSSSICMVD